MGRGPRGIWVAVLLAAALPGCGGEGATRFSGEAVTDAGGGGELVFAIAVDPGSLDPLRASSGSAQIVARQVFEPLVESLDGPYGEGNDRRGLALGWSPSGDFRVWSFQLRAGVRFQDGSPFNAGAVLANVSRWRTVARGGASAARVGRRRCSDAAAGAADLLEPDPEPAVPARRPAAGDRLSGWR